MLIYEKQTHDNSKSGKGKLIRTLYGTPNDYTSDSDLPLVFADTHCTELEDRPSLSATYVSKYISGGYDVMRLEDGKEILVGIQPDTNSDPDFIIGKSEPNYFWFARAEEGTDSITIDLPTGSFEFSYDQETWQQASIITIDPAKGDKVYLRGNNSSISGYFYTSSSTPIIAGGV